MGSRAGLQILDMEPLGIGLWKSTTKETLALSLVKLNTGHKQYDMEEKKYDLAHYPISGFMFGGEMASPRLITLQCLRLTAAAQWPVRAYMFGECIRYHPGGMELGLKHCCWLRLKFWGTRLWLVSMDFFRKLVLLWEASQKAILHNFPSPHFVSFRGSSCCLMLLRHFQTGKHMVVFKSLTYFNVLMFVKLFIPILFKSNGNLKKKIEEECMPLVFCFLPQIETLRLTL